jgi:hypothetical protein
MNIDIELLDSLTANADEIVFSPKQEKLLVKLLVMRDTIEAAIKNAELKIEAAALKVNPIFKSVQGDEIKASYRAYGSKYKIDASNLSLIPDGLFKTKVTYSPEVKAIDKWTEEHKGAPAGIIIPERKKVIKLSLKGGSDE